ncbi:stage III sporulation protein SpoIIIAB [Aneurinibacillus terranovensis]|uniref:stage III sporulation protein SpoIIIAB n=1 Tax=Aneurinibacillus terranovensis TaxID=278991 RepID=UPI0004808E18|nr:stage III sporulation protein SpoIIIAB [Aneurinibacillus terranovensis]
MLKLIGAAIILLSTTLAGLRVAGYFARRPLQIRQLRTALKILETEIVYGATPLYQALEHIANRLHGEVSRLFKTAARLLDNNDELTTYECFRKAIEQTWPHTAMKAPEKEMLLHLGTVLGQSDREDQKKHIELTIINLHSEENQAKENQAKYEKVAKSLGFLGGLLVVILLF